MEGLFMPVGGPARGLRRRRAARRRRCPACMTRQEGGVEAAVSKPSAAQRAASSPSAPGALASAPRVVLAVSIVSTCDLGTC
eukprot:363378-Chlamydomonas_euryale.AAC.16